MTSNAATLDALEPAEAAAPTPRPSRTTTRRVTAALAMMVMAAGLGLAWLGGATGVLGAAAAAGAAWQLRHLRRQPRPAGGQAAAGNPGSNADDAEDSDGDIAPGGRIGAELMVSQVVPVWQRQMLATRDTADAGLSQLLEAFSGFSGSLDALANQLGSASLSASPGAVDDAVQAQSPALAALLAPSQRAFAERDAAVAELGHCADGLATLQQLVKQAREIARHTRLVAFNASIEAQRGSTGASSSQKAGQASGSQAVANEVRMLAGRMAEVSEQIDRLATGLHGRLAGVRRHGEIHDTSPEELQLEIELRAREALSGLINALGGALQGSSSVQQASAQLRNQIDDALVQFQFGDRVSQMLAILGNDMHNLVRWMAVHPYATQSDAAEWLTALEASYTMEEQRSQHHSNVHVDVASEIEFF